MDPRITAARPDIADIALADRLFAPYYARAEPRRCNSAAAMLRAAPSDAATAVSQILPGEEFHLLDISGDWCWGYCAIDGYVGYLPTAALRAMDATPTHLVGTTGALVFARPDIKAPLLGTLPVGSRVAGTVVDGFLALADGGHLHPRHIVPIAARAADPVAIACSLAGMPYLWGGRGGGGIDCSGLVQIALARCGTSAPRDSDQQAASVGTALDADMPARRGDLIFFPGHVGLMVDGHHIVHANAYAMAVTIDPLADVVARIAADHAQPILNRRRLP
jgi:cell wall-associated NlpC family hydrolase